MQILSVTVPSLCDESVSRDEPSSLVLFSQNVLSQHLERKQTSDVCLSPSYSGGGGRKSPQTHEFKANGNNVLGRGEGQKDTDHGEAKTAG